jgi:hypothetical protein
LLSTTAQTKLVLSARVYREDNRPKGFDCGA